MATIRISGIESLGSVEGFTVTPDDRQTKVDVLDGTVVQDMGCFDEGMSFSFSTTFKAADFEKVKSLWRSREKVTFQDPAGTIFQDCRLVLKSWQTVDRFEGMAYKASCEIWRT